MLLKILYTACVFIICLIIYFKIRKNENSLAFIIITGIITTIAGNFLIPSGVSIFDIFNNENNTSENITINVAQQSETNSFSAEMYSNIASLSDLGCSEVKKAANAEEAADALFEICLNQPESLAAIVSVFPNALKHAGFEETDPIAIEKLLEGDGGGDLQNELIGFLRLSLDHPSTEYAYGKFTGSALTLDMCMQDENMKATPENIYLAWSAIELNDSPALIITIHLEGCEPETGIFDLQTGFQPFVEFHAIAQ